ncbi:MULTISPECIES: hypothetical protein, partial [Aeromonas]
SRRLDIPESLTKTGKFTDPVEFRRAKKLLEVLGCIDNSHGFGCVGFFLRLNQITNEAFFLSISIGCS